MEQRDHIVYSKDVFISSTLITVGKLLLFCGEVYTVQEVVHTGVLTVCETCVQHYI